MVVLTNRPYRQREIASPDRHLPDLPTAASSMQYLLLTGATGLLGRYVLRDALLAELPVAVLVRPSRRAGARQRVDELLTGWESAHGRLLPRPVVLTGDLAAAGCKLDPYAVEWLAIHCKAVVHSAADLTFYSPPETEKTRTSGTHATPEPWRTNVEGTRHLLELCERTGIKQFHHISTAYVCGIRSGLVREAELDVGQNRSNDYEQSKAAAERLVQAANHLDSATIYRPSIIVGDSRTGFTSTFQGFYAPLRLLAPSAPSGTEVRAVESSAGELFLKQLGLAGHERKNLVPVDWVSTAIFEIVRRPDLHGRTYHLTNPRPITARMVQQAIQMALGEPSAVSETSAGPSRQATASDTKTPVDPRWFRQQMDTYRAYFRDDPAFDDTNTRTALPQHPCPAIDLEMLVKLARFALRVNFTWRPPVVNPVKHDPQDHFATWFSSEPVGVPELDIIITGSGGGDWHVFTKNGRPVAVGRGLHGKALFLCRLSIDTWQSLVEGRLDISAAVYAGRLVIADNSPHDAAPAATDARHVGDPRFALVLAILGRLLDPPSNGSADSRPKAKSATMAPSRASAGKSRKASATGTRESVA